MSYTLTLHPRACLHPLPQPLLCRPTPRSTPRLVPLAAALHRRSFSSHPGPRSSEPARGAPSPSYPWLSLSLISLTTLSAGYVLGSVFPPSLATQTLANTLLRPAPPAPPPADSAQAASVTATIEAQLQQLEIVRSLLADDRWRVSRPFANADPNKLIHNLTAGTLRGPGKFAIPPIVFVNRDETEAIIVVHLGRSMCGHDGIVHGGLLATICDEGLARLAFGNLPSNIGVTAVLNVQYRKPTMAEQFVVLKTRLPLDPSKRPNGRKVWVEGRLENCMGEVLVEAEALYVEPRMAKLLKNSMVKEIIN